MLSQAHSPPSLARSDDGLRKRHSAFILKRKKRHSNTPAKEKIPGLEISDFTTEKLEYLVSLDLSNNPSTKEWKIKAAHELAARFIEGDASQSTYKAPHDHVKAHSYAQMEINMLSIEEIEIKYFSLDPSSDEALIMPWQPFNHTARKIRRATPEQRNKIKAVSFEDTQAIDEFIKKSNEELNNDKKADANAILLAWEKQLAAIRLAEHYRKLKKEKRDTQSALAAKFYKQAVQYFSEHEPPQNWLTSLLLKIISPRFNSIRLFIIRLNKFLTQLSAPLLATPFLKMAASILGLYFLAELLIDVGLVVKAWLYNSAGKFDPSWERLKLAFWDDNRPSRMANAIVWFSINLACLLLTIFLPPVGPLVPFLQSAAFPCGILTVSGCVFDAGAEVAIGAYGLYTINELRTRIDEDLKKLEHVDITRTFTDEEARLNPIGVAEQKQQITQKISLQEIREQLIKKRVAFENNRAYTVVIMTIMTIAAIFIFFPFAALPLAPLIATTIAFVVGSIFGGLGKFIFWNAPEFYQSGKALVVNGYQSIKEKLFGKTKELMEPIVSSAHHTADDWGVTSTKHIQSSLRQAHQEPTSVIPCATKKPIKAQTDFPLHRSPSGTLFVDERVQCKHANFLPPSPLVTPKNLKTM